MVMFGPLFGSGAICLTLSKLMLAVCEVEGETSNLACFSICVGFVGIIFGDRQTQTLQCVLHCLIHL